MRSQKMILYTVTFAQQGFGENWKGSTNENQARPNCNCKI